MLDKILALLQAVKLFIIVDPKDWLWLAAGCVCGPVIPAKIPQDAERPSIDIRIFPLGWNFRLTHSARSELENTENPNELSSNGLFQAGDLDDFRIFAWGLGQSRLTWEVNRTLTSDSHATIAYFVVLE